MPFTIKNFVTIRPYLFHLTAPENLPRIRTTRMLVPATDLLIEAGRSEVIRQKRAEALCVAVADAPVHVRDQAPLHEGNVQLEDGWDFGTLIEALNSRVYFWPGKDGGPIEPGKRHFERYKEERPAIIRVNSAYMFREYQLTPEFCKYNSGSPRCNAGRRSPRGARTFVACGQAGYTAGKVVEVTFSGPVRLPADAEISRYPDDTWKSFASVG